MGRIAAPRSGYNERVPDLGEMLLAAVRLAHALAAAVWVGGTLLYILVRPRIAGGPAAARTWGPFREALRLGIAVFVLTGVILATDRLGRATLPPIYLALLGAKVALGVWMFYTARNIGMISGDPDPALASWRRPESRMVGLGVAIYGLALALRGIYEEAIRW